MYENKKRSDELLASCTGVKLQLMIAFTIALTLFLVANPIGNTPTFVSLVKDFEFSRQKAILLREALFSMAIAYAFLFLGEPFLNIIHIEQYSVSISGGILLFVVALNMIFPPPSVTGSDRKPQEPFIVPIATPLIAGGGVFTTIIIYAKQNIGLMTLSLGIFIAWVAVTAVVVSAAYLQKILGKRGLLAMEQLMGMLLTMLSMEIIVNGVHTFVSQA